mmetsp:Transcript_12148/g.18771  ORF Transcript_12148/g.18771 Transcript_12148/m.18771 type:complete len:224 (-) Transcript_12148:100-771(-)
MTIKLSLVDFSIRPSVLPVSLSLILHPVAIVDMSICLHHLPLPLALMVFGESDEVVASLIATSCEPIELIVGPLAFYDLLIVHPSPNAMQLAILDLTDVNPIFILLRFDGEVEVDGDGRLLQDLLHRQGLELLPGVEEFLIYLSQVTCRIFVEDILEFQSLTKINSGTYRLLPGPLPGSLFLQGHLRRLERNQGLRQGLADFCWDEIGSEAGQGITQGQVGPG